MTSRHQRQMGPLWVWSVMPLAALVGLALGLLPSRLWPTAWVAWGVAVGVSACCLALGWFVWAARSARAAWAKGAVPGSHGGRPRRLGAASLGVVGLGILGAVVLAWSWTSWRAHLRAQAMWPADLGVRQACVQVRLDSLPQALPMGGWQVDAGVDLWAAVRGRACGPDALAASAEGPSADPPARPKSSTRKAAWLSANELTRLGQVRRVRLYWSGEAMPVPGQVWWVQGRWHRPDGVANPGGPDAVLLAWERGIGAVGQVDAGKVQRDEGAERGRSGLWGLAGQWDRWRAAIRAEIALSTRTSVQAGVLAGLTVGDQGAVSPEDWSVFRRTGVAHLMSFRYTAKHNCR